MDHLGAIFQPAARKKLICGSALSVNNGRAGFATKARRDKGGLMAL
jgi:hypothetical protein